MWLEERCISHITYHSSERSKGLKILLNSGEEESSEQEIFEERKSGGGEEKCIVEMVRT